MKTIAIFTGYYLPHVGGVERYTYHIAKELIKQGYRVFIITSRYDESLREIEQMDEITIYRLPTYRLFVSRHPILKFNKKQRELVKELEKQQIDFVILQTRFWLTTVVGGRFAKRNKIPRILIEHGTSHFTVHNPILDFFGRTYEHILTNYVKTLVKKYYGVSSQCVNWLKHFKIEAKGVLYNSIDITKYQEFNMQTYPLPVKEDTIKILFVGRMIQDKGIIELIEAYKRLKKKYDIELVLAGEGPLFKKIKEENKDIIFTGSLKNEDVMKLYNSIDIFINPSYSEGLPTTVLEAGLMKCAVVATDVGGTSEIIEDGKEGLLCKPEVTDIVEKLEILIKNKNLRKQLGENLHNKVIKQFSWENTTKQLLDIIEK